MPDDEKEKIDQIVKMVEEHTGDREKMVAAREKNVSRIVEAAEAAISCIEDEKPKLAKALRQKIDDALNGRVGTY